MMKHIENSSGSAGNSLERQGTSDAAGDHLGAARAEISNELMKSGSGNAAEHSFGRGSTAAGHLPKLELHDGSAKGGGGGGACAPEATRPATGESMGRSGAPDSPNDSRPAGSSAGAPGRPHVFEGGQAGGGRSGY